MVQDNLGIFERLNGIALFVEVGFALFGVNETRPLAVLSRLADSLGLCLDGDGAVT
jgi:hypothetical protein